MSRQAFSAARQKIQEVKKERERSNTRYEYRVNINHAAGVCRDKLIGVVTEERRAVPYARTGRRNGTKTGAKPGSAITINQTVEGQGGSPELVDSGPGPRRGRCGGGTPAEGAAEKPQALERGEASPFGGFLLSVIEKVADNASGFDRFRAELAKPAGAWSAGKIAGCIAAAAFKARALGDAEFDKGE